MEDHTFIIPAYKDSPYLEECLVSLINQTKNSNIIITTSTPSDYIQLMAKKFSVEVIVNTAVNDGIAADWNFALAQAKTKFVTIAHQDDIYDSPYLERVLCALNRKKVLIVFTDYCEMINGRIRQSSFNFFTKKILLLPFLISPGIKNKFFKRLPLLVGNAICCPSVTFNTEELSGFSFSPEYHYSLDWKAWLDISEQKGAFVFVNKKLMKHRLHQGSETSAQIKTAVRRTEELRILQSLWGKHFGRFISNIYLLGHKENMV